ncbi:MAG: fumarylacetoacetate hydrolase [Acidimicrobiia bacterium]|nr:fumarylacetoacetate hydrolase [Acidimicrobiia bacterium]
MAAPPPPNGTWLVRAADRVTGSIRVGVVDTSGLHPLARVDDLGSLLELDLAGIRSVVESSLERPPMAVDAHLLLPPIDGDTEVWAAGVTYESSRLARMEESETRDVYAMVYDAERPELFYKTSAWKATTDGEVVASRRDSDNDVPEPELALIVNRHQEIVGFAAANDMSSRSIEGANPLYLPQAKVYAGSFAISAGIRPAWEVPEPNQLTIVMTIRRGADLVFEGSASTSQMHRSFAGLVEHLFRHQELPQGAVLSTGTCIVPPLDQPTLSGDIVTIEIHSVGTLTSLVTDEPTVGPWLTARRRAPLTRFESQP